MCSHLHYIILFEGNLLTDLRAETLESFNFKFHGNDIMAYCIAGNIGGILFWQIWQFKNNTQKLYGSHLELAKISPTNITRYTL